MQIGCNIHLQIALKLSLLNLKNGPILYLKVINAFLEKQSTSES